MFIFQTAVPLLTAIFLLAQGSAPDGSDREVGTVRHVDPAARFLIVASDAGGERKVAIPLGVTVRGIGPGQKDLSGARTLGLSDIQPGDRVVARGTVGEGRALTAASVVVMTKSDVARKRETETADWRRRGVSGKVSLIDLAGRQLTVVGGPRTSQVTSVVRPTVSAALRKYRLDSIRFADALPAKLEDMRVGDQVYALGDRRADGVLEAEQIVFGTFRTFAAIVSSVDTTGPGLVVKDLDGNRPVQVRLSAASVLRRLTPEAVQALAAGRGKGSRNERSEDGNRVASAKADGATVDIQTLIGRLPSLRIDEIRPGEVLVICASHTIPPAAVTAFTILGSAEALLQRSSEEQREFLGSWELSLEPDQP